ncbi:hypothetical protein SB725_30800, partial [Pseudomonas sp. SIMBA_041]
GLKDQSQTGLRLLVGRLQNEPALRSKLSAQEVASVLNIVSKRPSARPCIEVAQALVDRLKNEPALREKLQEQSLANVLTALSKWPERAVQSI